MNRDQIHRRRDPARGRPGRVPRHRNRTKTEVLMMGGAVGFVPRPRPPSNGRDQLVRPLCPNASTSPSGRARKRQPTGAASFEVVPAGLHLVATGRIAVHGGRRERPAILGPRVARFDG